MKKIVLLIFSIISCYGFGQDVLMQNGTVTACSGIFYDSGGQFSNYSNDESFVVTICPEGPGQRTRLDFQEFFELIPYILVDLTVQRGAQ